MYAGDWRFLAAAMVDADSLLVQISRSLEVFHERFGGEASYI